MIGGVLVAVVLAAIVFFGVIDCDSWWGWSIECLFA